MTDDEWQWRKHVHKNIKKWVVFIVNFPPQNTNFCAWHSIIFKNKTGNNKNPQKQATEQFSFSQLFWTYHKHQLSNICPGEIIK